MKIILTRDKKLLRSSLKAVGSETHGVEENVIAWIAYESEQVIGLVGLRHLRPDYVVIDSGPVARKDFPNARKRTIQKALLNVAEKYALQYSASILTHNADESIKFLEGEGFVIQDENSLDPEYSHPCFSCRLKDRECFPKLMQKKIGQ
jgi:N-acetylglutamate synthase-like GNAT family acetyltransferase